MVEKVIPGTPKAPDVHTISDDQLTRLLGTVEKCEEKLHTLDDMSTKYPILEAAFDDMKERLKLMEDKRGGGPREWRSAFSANDEQEQRRRKLCEFVVDVYRCDFVRNYEPTSGLMTRDSGDVQVGNADAAGGVTVPDLVAPEIVRIVRSFGRARELFRPFPMGSDVVKLPTRDESGGKGVKVIWVDQAVAPTEDKEEFSSATLAALKLAALTEMSRELETDSSVNFAGYLLDVMGEATAREEDNQGFVATTPFLGVYANTLLVTERTSASSFASLSYDDLVGAETAVDEQLIGEGTWVFNSKMLKFLRSIKDTTNMPIWAPMAVGQPATILGRPYRVVNVMNKTDGADKVMIGYGDHRFHVFGTRDPFAVAFSSEAGFKRDTRWIRITERIAFVTTVPGAFSVIKTAAS